MEDSFEYLTTYQNNRRRKISDLFHKERDINVVIYGAGNMGRRVKNIVKKNNLNVVAFIDKRSSDIRAIENIPVYSPADIPQTLITFPIIVSVMLDRKKYIELKKQLTDKGFQNVVNGYEISTIDMFCNNVPVINDELVKRISDAYTLLADDKSRELYKKILEWHFKGDYSNEDYDDELIQYFKLDFDFVGEHESFVDCGAYIGDSLENLLTCVNEIDAYYGFEPDHNNFNKLNKAVEEKSNKIKWAQTYECAVSNINTQGRFLADSAGDSFLCTEGNSLVDIVRIDDVLGGKKVTFIKMDIEGAELEALEGCENTIRANIPKLAICSYHKVSHLWEIIETIHQYSDKYKFYLRNHYFSSLETVVYAIKGE